MFSFGFVLTGDGWCRLLGWWRKFPLPWWQQAMLSQGSRTTAGNPEPRLQEMRGRHVQRNIIVYNTALNVLEFTGRWHDALKLLEAVEADELQPDLLTFSALISCSWLGSWLWIIIQLQAGVQDGYRGSDPSPGVFFCTFFWEVLVRWSKNHRRWCLTLSRNFDLSITAIMSYSSPLSSTVSIWIIKLEGLTNLTISKHHQTT